MSQKLTAAIPPNFDLGANFVVQLAAVDPTTGAAVAGVKVSNVAIMAAAVVSAASDDTSLPDYEPLFLPIPPDEITADEGNP